MKNSEQLFDMAELAAKIGVVLVDKMIEVCPQLKRDKVKVFIVKKVSTYSYDQLKLIAQNIGI